MKLLIVNSKTSRPKNEIGLFKHSKSVLEHSLIVKAAYGRVWTELFETGI